MAEQPPIDIRADHWQIVCDILQRHVPSYEVWAFGSRAKWTAKPHSDLDLAVITDQPLPLAVSAALADDFSESDLPWRVDVVDWATTSETFRKIIERDKVVVQKAYQIGLQGWGMSFEWPSVFVEEVCSLIVDCVNKTAPVVLDTTPYRMIRTTNVRNGRVDLSDCKYVTEDTFQKWTRRARLEVGDVILTREAPIGEVGYVTEAKGVFLGQRLMQYRPNPSRLDSRFLLYSFLSPALQHQFGSHEGSGSVVSHIRVGDCFKFKLKLPPLAVQREVASILGALDDRISLLRETNATLEAIAQALFKSWFVDFDPVRAKMEGRVPEGMDEATAALFPDSFEETELGAVPRGWLPVRLDSFIELAYGKALKAENRRSGHVPVYGSGGITGWHDQALVQQASVIVGRKGTVGSLYWERRPFFPIDTVFHVRSKRPLVYCYHLLQTLGLEKMNTDAAVPGLNRENVYRLMVPNVPDTVLNAFNDVVAVLRTVADENEDKAQTLASLRDTLLPRLISGQLRLPEAQTAIKGAFA